MKVRKDEQGPKSCNFLIEEIQIKSKYLNLSLVHPKFVSGESRLKGTCIKFLRGQRVQQLKLYIDNQFCVTANVRTPVMMAGERGESLAMPKYSVPIGRARLKKASHWPKIRSKAKTFTARGVNVEAAW